MAGNLCNKTPSGYSNKRAVLVILSMQSLVSIEQQNPGGPVTFWWPVWGQRLPKQPKLLYCSLTAKMCAKPNMTKMTKTALSRVSQQELCAGVFCVFHQGPGTLSSLPQLIPARLGPRSLAQLPKGSGRVPLVQGASQRVYKAQESLSVPRDVPRRSTWSDPPSAHRNCAQDENTLET